MDGFPPAVSAGLPEASHFCERAGHLFTQVQVMGKRVWQSFFSFLPCHVLTWVYTCAHVCTYAHRVQRVTPDSLLGCSSPYILRQGFLLNLEFTDSVKPSGL